MSRPGSRTKPAGESPVPVSVGARGSRPQPAGEIPQATAGRRKPLRREQERRPQHEVNTAASSQLQSESRAVHVTAKAMSTSSKSGKTMGISPGYGEQHALNGSVRNSRDPSAQPSSGQGRSYKPKAKSSGAQRESEGAIVPAMGVKKNAPGGKGPCFDHAGDEGKHEGMAGTARSKHPEGREPLDKVRRLQRKLWAAAKQQPGRRFHALYDRIHRSDVLWNAWWRVRRNRGAAGHHPMTLPAVGGYRPPPPLQNLPPPPHATPAPP